MDYKPNNMDVNAWLTIALFSVAGFLGVVGYFLKILHADFKSLTDTVNSIQRELLKNTADQHGENRMLNQLIKELRTELDYVKSSLAEAKKEFKDFMNAHRNGN